jgi:hypothetical protein
MDEDTVLWAACIEAAATLIAGDVAGERGGAGWPEEQIADLAQRLFRAVKAHGK